MDFDYLLWVSSEEALDSSERSVTGSISIFIRNHPFCFIFTDSLDGQIAIFQTCDAISIHLALNDATRGYVNAERLAMMKPDAVIVNTARGSLVDDEAMVAALKNHQIGGAGLDVFAEEPLPVTSPYIGLDNVILTPHVASSTVESLWNIYAMAIDVAYDFFHGTESAQTKRCWLN